MLKNLVFPRTCQLLVKPHLMLVLCLEYTMLVATALTDIYFSTNVVLYFKGLSLKNGGRWSNMVTKFGFSKVKSIKVARLFDREETDADRCDLLRCR